MPKKDKSIVFKPGDTVELTWLDAVHDESESNATELERLDPIEVTSWGVLVSHNNTKTIVAASSHDNGDGTVIYRDNLCVPAAMVKSITKLKPVKIAQKSLNLGRNKYLINCTAETNRHFKNHIMLI